jgi:hypothetical protein
MGQRFHRGFTAAEKAELWDRWKRGESRDWSMSELGNARCEQMFSAFPPIATKLRTSREVWFVPTCDIE